MASKKFRDTASEVGKLAALVSSHKTYAHGSDLATDSHLQCFALPFALRNCKIHVWFCVSVTDPARLSRIKARFEHIGNFEPLTPISHDLRRSRYNTHKHIFRISECKRQCKALYGRKRDRTSGEISRFPPAKGSDISRFWDPFPSAYGWDILQSIPGS